MLYFVAAWCVLIGVVVFGLSIGILALPALIVLSLTVKPLMSYFGLVIEHLYVVHTASEDERRP